MLGVHAPVVAANVLVALAGGLVAVIYARWWWSVRRERAMPLAALPLSVAWLIGWTAVSASFYAAARVLLVSADGGVNLWTSGAWVIAIERAAVIAGVVIHLRPYWRARGLPERAVRARTAAFSVALVSLWLALLVWLR